MDEIKTPTSSTLNRVKYFGDTGVLEVEFKTGAIYHYANVEQSVWDELTEAESIGSFVMKRIKAVYECTKIN